MSQTKNELMHYGKMGMKWGVRRTSAASGNPKSARAADKQVKSEMRKSVKNRRLLSNEEITAKIGRLEKEKKLRELTDAEINRGKKATNDIIKSAGTKVATTMVAGATLYAVKYAMTGKLDLKDAAAYVAPKPGKK